VSAASAHGVVYLTSYLASLQDYLRRTDVTDIYVNRPGEVWVETLRGQIERHDLPLLDAATLDRLAQQIAALSHQGINRQNPLLSASLPDGARIQVIAPPATRGGLALAIRKHQVTNLQLDDYATTGAFDDLQKHAETDASANDLALADLHGAKDFVGLLKMAVGQRRNILISGGTSTGKTTFLSTLMREVAPEERLILIEDTAELELRHANAIGLIAARGALGEAVVDMGDLLTASLRMRPDRIIMGELRGPEAFTFLRAINTGHPGSMTTVHADSPERAVEQIALLILQSGTRLDRDSIIHYIRSTIDIYVQLGRKAGRRSVTEIKLRSAS
jgi:type IV secretion system protein VirB11